MIDADRLLRRLLGNPTATLGGGLLGGLLMTKRGRRYGKKALKLGGLVAIGALAYNAYQRYKDSNQEEVDDRREPALALAPPPTQSGFLPEDEQARNELALTLVRAMIAGAKADGVLEPREMELILRRVSEGDFTAEEKAHLMDELHQTPDLDALVEAAGTPQVASEVYIAALMTIDPEEPEKDAWLVNLADRLGLEPGLVQSIHAEAAA